MEKLKTSVLYIFLGIFQVCPCQSIFKKKLK
ncbi:hypothetical protein E2C01_026646 [Portunus trituberculatus]|uniref:Uncharacterized protein n=1 Tax=Portunus trituberculatus TaxID=210409 RepID=A0A5B7EGP1_PORTR|nr:hypothetical protein [Portunus trituberculatus]